MIYNSDYPKASGVGASIIFPSGNASAILLKTSLSAFLPKGTV